MVNSRKTEKLLLISQTSGGKLVLVNVPVK